MGYILEPENFRDLFYNGMKRGLSALLPVPPGGTVLNLGSGNNPIHGAVNLDPNGFAVNHRGISKPGEYKWRAPMLEYNEETVSAIHAYHFLEHLHQNDAHHLLLEVQRVLKPGGVFYYCVPYAMAPIAYMDIDHKTFWTEETMRTLLESRGYHSAVVDKLQIDFQIIAGITSQNLAVLGALQKSGE